jgi:hypothetical protein
MRPGHRAAFRVLPFQLHRRRDTRSERNPFQFHGGGSAPDDRGAFEYSAAGSVFLGAGWARA